MNRYASTRLRDLVRDELEQAGWTQTQVAEALGYSAKHISHVLVGHTGLTVDMAAAILALLGRQLRITAEPVDGTS